MTSLNDRGHDYICDLFPQKYSTRCGYQLFVMDTPSHHPINFLSLNSSSSYSCGFLQKLEFICNAGSISGIYFQIKKSWLGSNICKYLKVIILEFP